MKKLASGRGEMRGDKEEERNAYVGMEARQGSLQQNKIMYYTFLLHTIKS